MCDKAVDNYVYALKFVFDCHKTQKMCKESYWCLSFVIDCLTQRICDKIVSNLKYYLDRYKT